MGEFFYYADKCININKLYTCKTAVGYFLK